MSKEQPSNFVIRQENERKSVSKTPLKNMIMLDESEDIDVDVDQDIIEEETPKNVTPPMTPPIEREVLFSTTKAPVENEKSRRIKELCSNVNTQSKNVVMEELREKHGDFENSTTDTTVDPALFLRFEKSTDIDKSLERSEGSQSVKLSKEKSSTPFEKTKVDDVSKGVLLADGKELDAYLKDSKRNSELPSDAATEAGYTIFSESKETDNSENEKMKLLKQQSMEIDSHVLEVEEDKQANQIVGNAMEEVKDKKEVQTRTPMEEEGNDTQTIKVVKIDPKQMEEIMAANRDDKEESRRASALQDFVKSDSEELMEENERNVEALVFNKHNLQTPGSRREQMQAQILKRYLPVSLDSDKLKGVVLPILTSVSRKGRLRYIKKVEAIANGLKKKKRLLRNQHDVDELLRVQSTETTPEFKRKLRTKEEREKKPRAPPKRKRVYFFVEDLDD
ncbi:hypothetical protein EIN_057580 [Entamoeba invadens IP1]|uniref:hypothetical protein n=1 Tax=Entamoeba invadens IP1 TaxID=370355 RepID=UPI0002C3D187|nr:hypothetical protein EIN_057580 [Entamoeba invadens IP1]ELP93353.1 hypothetical protein EIN_057580 [Entamoeba invadens IP1]|eukprot:XP_004260124.1 hypothetical protein EIN_057580 [Entamoeba invadens IP1]